MMNDYQAEPGLLDGKIILVTGAGDGIGRVASQTFAGFGATVILLGRTVSKLEAVYDEIVATGHPEPGIVPMDLTTATGDDVSSLARVIQDRYSRLDGLLHNAALLGERIPFEHYNLNEWEKVMRVNFSAVVALTQALLPLLKAAKEASVIFTSSGVGATPRAYWGAYAVSKYALEGFAKLLADELENTSSVRFNILNPGGTRTAMRAAAYPSEDPSALKTSEDLMPLYLYLMGDDSAAENGKTFTY